MKVYLVTYAEAYEPDYHIAIVSSEELAKELKALDKDFDYEEIEVDDLSGFEDYALTKKAKAALKTIIKNHNGD